MNTHILVPISFINSKIEQLKKDDKFSSMNESIGINREIRVLEDLLNYHQILLDENDIEEKALTAFNIKTSQEWQELFPSIKVIDPDGWDRSNFQFSWYEEKITKDEYDKRLFNSTIKGKLP